MRLPVSQLKRLVKSRAGRIAELQMEIKILEGIMERKVSEGDLGGSGPEASPARKAEPRKVEVKAAETAVQESPKQEPEQPESRQEVLTKVKEKSSDHAFQEIE